MICPVCNGTLRPWFDTHASATGCRVLGVQCSGSCAKCWSSERVERIYNDVHNQMESNFLKMVTFMDFPTDAKEQD